MSNAPLSIFSTLQIIITNDNSHKTNIFDHRHLISKLSLATNSIQESTGTTSCYSCRTKSTGNGRKTKQIAMTHTGSPRRRKCFMYFLRHDLIQNTSIVHIRPKRKVRWKMVIMFLYRNRYLPENHRGVSQNFCYIVNIFNIY